MQRGNPDKLFPTSPTKAAKRGGCACLLASDKTGCRRGRRNVHREDGIMFLGRCNRQSSGYPTSRFVRVFAIVTILREDILGILDFDAMLFRERDHVI